MNRTKHVIVTGGAGFIGSHIAHRLLSEGHKVTILDNLSSGKMENVPAEAAFINMDLGNRDSYAALQGIDCEAIFHLAGQSSGEASFIDPLYDFRSHVVSTFSLLEWCRKKKVRRFMYASSMAVYGDPDYLPVNETHVHKPKTFYAAAKSAAEAYVRLHQTLGVDTTIFRLFNVYGPGQNLENQMQGMVSIYLSYMLANVPITVKGSKERFRDLIYIDDVVDVWIAAFKNPVSYGKIYNVASGKKTRVEELLEALKESFGCKEYPIEYKNGTPGDQFGLVADTTLIENELKWKAKVSLSKGLSLTVKFEKERLKIGKKS